MTAGIAQPLSGHRVAAAHRLCSRPGGDRLERADGGLYVLDIELAQQLHGGDADVLAEILVFRLPGGGQIERCVAANEAVGLEIVKQSPDSVRTETGALEHTGEVGPWIARP